MNELLTSIKEVREGGMHHANWYLDHGYVLLDIQSSARPQHMPAMNPGGTQYFVRRNPIYVVGRPEGVDPCESPPQWRPATKPDTEATVTPSVAP